MKFDIDKITDIRHKKRLLSGRNFYNRCKDNRLCTHCATKLDDNYTATICKKCNDISYRAKKKRVDDGFCGFCGKLRENTTNTHICNNCSIELSKELVSRSKKHKKMAVELLGGKCNRCNYKNENLSVYDFHHKDPSMKEHQIGRHLLKKKYWKNIEPEILKCELLCANCHRLEHNGVDNA